MKRCITLTAALILSAGLFAQQKNSAQIAESIDKYIQEVKETWQLPGLAAAFSLNGEIILSKGYGVKEQKMAGGIGFRGLKDSDRSTASGGVVPVVNPSNAPTGPRTLFQIGSVSKSFTATVMASIVDEGLVKWEDTIKNILPDFRMYDSWVTENMQVKEIMTHHTGLIGQGGTYFPNVGYTRDEIYQMIPLMKPVYSFRNGYQYNNTTFLIAEKVIERVTGKSWEENVRERVFKPLGMTSSTMNAEGYASAKDVATPHDYSFTTPLLATSPCEDLIRGEERKGTPKIVVSPLYGDEQALWWLTGIGPAGSICSCANDMVRYAQMHLNNGFIVNTKEDGSKDTVRVLSEKAAKFLHKGQTICSQDSVHTTLYGHCWFIEQNNRYRLYYHTGTTWGMTAICFFVPEVNLCGAVLVNCEASDNPRLAIMNRLIDLAMGAPAESYTERFKDYNKVYFEKWLAAREKGWEESEAKFAKRTFAAAPATKSITGLYNHPNALFGEVKVEERNGELYVTTGKGRFCNILRHIDGNKYEFRADGHGFPLIFNIPDGETKATSLTIQLNYGEEKDFGDWVRVATK